MPGDSNIASAKSSFRRNSPIPEFISSQFLWYSSKKYCSQLLADPDSIKTAFDFDIGTLTGFEWLRSSGWASASDL